MLIGPNEDFERVVYMGVVAHICAAAPNGPRYDQSMSAEERAREENGLLLCRYCAALVDVDPVSYPAELLHLWKEAAYRSALNQLAVPVDGAEDSRCWSVVGELVRTSLCIYQTQGTISKEARFRSYAGILYQLLFEALPHESDYGKQTELWVSAVEKIADDGLEHVHVRAARYDQSFPRRYRYLMDELWTYSFHPQEQKARLLNMIEGIVRELFHSGEVFGLKENNAKACF